MAYTSQRTNISSEKKKRELTTAMNNFYANPVAKASLELFLTVGLVLFLGVFAIRPTIVTMSDLIKEIETKTTLSEALTKKLAALQTAQTQYLNIEQQIPILDSAIPEQPEIILTTKLIEKIAADSKVVIKNLNISELPENTQENVEFTQKSKQKVNISLNITGDYVSIREFAEALRNSRKSFIIESIVFSLEEDRGNKKLSANLTVAAPYFGVETTKEAKKK
jgi:hypothetical protein